MNTSFNTSKLNAENTVKGILLNHGISISDEECNYLELYKIDKINGKITCRNKQTGEKITFNCSGFVVEDDEKKDIPSVTILTSNDQETFITETFYQVKDINSNSSWEQKASSTWNDSSAIVKSRTYFDVDTKYGKICVLLEERITKDYPYRRIALFHGSHNTAINQVTNNFRERCFLDWRSFDATQSERFLVGYKRVNCPEMVIENIGREEHEYYYSHDKSFDLSSIILQNGLTKIDDSFFLPERFRTIGADKLIREHNEGSYDLRAYFVSLHKMIAFLKKGETITVEVHDYDSLKNGREAIVSNIFASPAENESVSISDILSCLSIEENLSDFIRNNLDFFNTINTHGNRVSLYPSKYKELLSRIETKKEDGKLAQFAEELINNASTFLRIPIERIVGEDSKTKDEKSLTKSSALHQ